MAIEREESLTEHWRKFGKWLEEQRLTARLNATQAAKGADIHLTSWSRIENGQAGTKRTTLPRILAAVGIRPEDPRFLEGYRMAGFVPPDPFSAESVTFIPGPIGNNPNGASGFEFTLDDPMLAAIAVLYKTAPEELHPRILGNVVKTIREFEREKVDIGKRLVDEDEQALTQAQDEAAQRLKDADRRTGGGKLAG